MTEVDGGGRVRSAGVPASQRPACDVAPLDRRPSSTWLDQVVFPASTCGRIPGDPAGTGPCWPGMDPAVGVDLDGPRSPLAVRP
jgi:hypothetical protein